MNLSSVVRLFVAVFFGVGTWTVCADEQPATWDWAYAALLGQAPPTPKTPRVGLDVIRQDYGELGMGKSVIGTPLTVGKKRCEHGLGVNSLCDIVVRLPGPGKTFEADAGMDNNQYTAGGGGSAVFVIEIGGKETFRSDVRRGGTDPVPVRVDLKGARELILRVLDSGDGPWVDHADWADASVTLTDGRRLWLDEMPLISAPLKLSKGIPFSFVYGGKPSSQFLSTWKRDYRRETASDGKETHVVTFTDPATRLQVCCETTLFRDHPGVDWLLRFKNTGPADTRIIERILPLDLGIGDVGDAALHIDYGGSESKTSYAIEKVLASGSDIRFPSDETPLTPDWLPPAKVSQNYLPFFNLDWHGAGLIGAIGWTGQWEMRFQRETGKGPRVQAGQQLVHLKLHPGESIRTPRILLVNWRGDDRIRGHNLLRRLLIGHYLPRINGEVATPPIANTTAYNHGMRWFRQTTGHSPLADLTRPPGWNEVVFPSLNAVTEANQLEVIRKMPEVGFEVFWIDAGWYVGNWIGGEGNWTPKPEAFPKGLRPISDAAHARGMKFLLWFEPERVMPGTRIAKEHPEWLIPVRKGMGSLFNLGIPEARMWMTDLLSKCIEDWGIDIYRQDHNANSLPHWRAADAPDRRGITEIRHVEGLYAMWDELLRRHPGLTIDNANWRTTGPDIEAMKRSVGSLTTSETAGMGAPFPLLDQVENAHLNLWIPLHGTLCFGFDPYVFRSAATNGVAMGVDMIADYIPRQQAKAALDELKGLRPCYLGDFYPLMPLSADEGSWCGWQFDRPEIDRGFAVYFRRSKSPYIGVTAGLRGLDPTAKYEVTFKETFDVKEKRTLSGAELAKAPVLVSTTPGSMLIRYRKTAKPE